VHQQPHACFQAVNNRVRVLQCVQCTSSARSRAKSW
jgi:hypothetical protein